MDNNNHNHGSNSGFLLGVIVGVLLTLLFTTKRGRAILRDVVDKGIQKFSNLEELTKEIEDDDFLEEDGDDYIQEEVIHEEPKEAPVEKKVEIKQVKEEKPIEEKVLKEEEPKKEKPEPEPEEKRPSNGKRWFRRGLKKRS